MSDKDNIQKILDLSSDGIITSGEVTSNGFHRGILRKMTENGNLYNFGRGLYMKTDSWEDDFLMLQYKYSRGIYSYDTALYLHGFTDRTPIRYTMTFPKGYNTVSLKQEPIIIKRVIPENYSLGITEIRSPCGNTIHVYDLERTLCDILRGKGSDIEIINDAMKRYVESKNKDIDKLLRYAEKLHVKPKILNYLEVLL